jgi:energy-coupling factor transport system substrate-specific component
MEKKSLWKFGTREVVFTAIGAALTFVLGLISIPIPGTANVSIYPSVVIPMFFGVAFGPVVGFLSYFIGALINGLVSGGVWWWWLIGGALMGFFPGLIANQIVNFKDRNLILKAELWVVIGVVVGMGLASISEMWVSGADIAAVVLVNFLPAAIVDLIVGLILVPILMVAYNAVLSRSGR